MFSLNSNGVTRQQNAWIYEIIQIQNEISQLIFEILDKIYQLPFKSSFKIVIKKLGDSKV